MIEDLIRRLETRLKNTLDKDDAVVYNLARALEVLERVRYKRPAPRGRQMRGVK